MAGRPLYPAPGRNRRQLAEGDQGVARSTSKAFLVATRDFFKMGGIMNSAALAFYALMSFIPLAFLLTAGLTHLLGSNVRFEQFMAVKLETLPWVKKFLLERMKQFRAQTPGLGWISLGVLIWMSGVFFSALSSSFARIWSPPKHSKIVRFIIPWLVGPVLSVVLILVITTGHIATYIPFSLFQIPPELITFAGQAMLIFIIYRLLLPRRCPSRPMAITGLFLALAIQGLTTLFTTILWAIPNYKLIYGTLTSTVLFLLWLQYGMALILWGAHFLKNKNAGA